MGKFSPTKLQGECEEIDNPSTAYGRRRRNWIDAHGAVPSGQFVDARCGNERWHRAAARLPPSTDRAAGQVPQDRGPRSQAEGRVALRGSGRPPLPTLPGEREKQITN
jgi:hypothetical protein